jgi:hypothetical protein
VSDAVQGLCELSGTVLIMLLRGLVFVGDEAGVDAAQKEAVAKKAIAAAKAQLQTLLDAPLPDARTAGASQKKRARTERRGGKLTPVPAAVGGKKGGKYKAAAAPVVDNNWKRRSSFFVFAK